MVSKRLKNRVNSLFLLVLLVGSGLLAAFHHHEGMAKDPEHCASCHLGQQAGIGKLEAAATAISAPRYFEEGALSLASPKRFASFFLLGKFSQAPPIA